MSPCFQPDIWLYLPDIWFHTSEMGFSYPTPTGSGIPWLELLTPPVFTLPETPFSEPMPGWYLRTREPPVLHRLCFILWLLWIPYFLTACLIPGPWPLSRLRSRLQHKPASVFLVHLRHPPSPLILVWQHSSCFFLIVLLASCTTSSATLVVVVNHWDNLLKNSLLRISGKVLPWVSWMLSLPFLYEQ